MHISMAYNSSLTIIIANPVSTTMDSRPTTGVVVGVVVPVVLLLVICGVVVVVVMTLKHRSKSSSKVNQHRSNPMSEKDSRLHTVGKYQRIKF